MQLMLQTYCCRFSYSGNWELVKSIVGKKEKAMSFDILMRELEYGSK